MTETEGIDRAQLGVDAGQIGANVVTSPEGCIWGTGGRAYSEEWPYCYNWSVTWEYGSESRELADREVMEVQEWRNRKMFTVE